MPGREPSIRRSRFIKGWASGLAAALAAVAFPAAAEDLLQVYREAQRYDAVYGAARFSLEAGLVGAGVLFVAGFGLVALIGWRWAHAGFGPLDEIRPLLLAVTLIMIGVQSAFNAFFLSLLSVESRAVEPR